MCSNFCSDPRYNVMLECWRYDPKDRPGFTKLATNFLGLMHQQGIMVEVSKDSSVMLFSILTLSITFYRTGTLKGGGGRFQ
jgi:hypothetical protein